jgi:hypothetical protein
MKTCKILLPLFLFFVTSCASASHDWETVRPIQERLISLELKTGHFRNAADVHVSTFVIPDKIPEVRLVIVSNINGSNETQLNSLKEEVEELVSAIMPFTTNMSRDTSRLMIQVTCLGGGRKMMEYSKHKWKEISANTTDAELRREAKWAQNKIASQRGFE